jgi:hypothetical protein
VIVIRTTCDGEHTTQKLCVLPSPSSQAPRQKRLGWLRNMFFSLIQQLACQDLMWYALDRRITSLRRCPTAIMGNLLTGLCCLVLKVEQLSIASEWLFKSQPSLTMEQVIRRWVIFLVFGTYNIQICSKRLTILCITHGDSNPPSPWRYTKQTSSTIETTLRCIRIRRVWWVLRRREEPKTWISSLTTRQYNFFVFTISLSMFSDRNRVELVRIHYTIPAREYDDD